MLATKKLIYYLIKNPFQNYTGKQITAIYFSTGSDKGNKIKTILDKTFPGAKHIDVIDVSGGCGEMYEIDVCSTQFKGLSLVKQHKMVTQALKEEIKDMHGLRIHTSST